MKKIGSYFYVFLVAFLFVIPSCDKDNNEPSTVQLKFVSEEYKPFNYTENSEVKGLASDLLSDVCEQLNMDCQIDFMPWETGYKEVLENENTVLFTTVLNSTRRDLFKWAGPFASLDWNFYSKAENQIAIKTLQEAKAVSNIGVIAGYAIEEYLIEQGFSNLVYCSDLNEGLVKLMNGEIDLFPTNKYSLESTLGTLELSTFSVSSVYTIKTELLYYAFNKNTSDDVVADFQAAIDFLKNNGTLKQLSQDYLNTSEFPDILQIYTEPYPPLTFLDNTGGITGYGSDIVKEIMKRHDLFYKINLSSWSNGYQLTLNNPNLCLYTMDRTEIREDLFQWVGPIGTNTTWIYTKAGSGITINSLDDAKNLEAIGTVDSWFSTQHLQEEGFENLVYDSDPEVLAKMLLNDEINAFVCTDITFPTILKDLDYSNNNVIPAFSLLASDFYIGFSNNTSTTIVNNWQQTLESIKTDGTFNAIHTKWFPKLGE
ncbi:MAG: transporter substrate-binding domain-containing protein [Prolixibacteraceae bacterium]|jgi:ABC-type amino acid transport substrate-binding protein|nr:transporter substrate-binding domain-containing protein [Prolixibacteraceae bacterium]